MAKNPNKFLGSVTTPAKRRNKLTARLNRQAKEYGITSTVDAKGNTVYSAKSKAGQSFLKEYSMGLPKLPKKQNGLPKRPKVKPGYPKR